MYDESKNKRYNIFHQKKNKLNESAEKILMCMIYFDYYISHNFH